MQTIVVNFVLVTYVKQRNNNPSVFTAMSCCFHHVGPH